MTTTLDEIKGCGEKLRGSYFHAASMASGELFHTNILAYLLDSGRDDNAATKSSVQSKRIASFLGFCECNDWVNHQLLPGHPKIDVERAKATARDKLGKLANDGLLQSITTDFLSQFNFHESESENGFVRREANHFDLTVTLYESSTGEIKATWRKKKPRNDPANLSFRIRKAKTLILVIENKVKSIARLSQIQGYARSLESLAKGGGQDARSKLVVLSLFPVETALKEWLGTRHRTDVGVATVNYVQLADWLAEARRALYCGEDYRWLEDYVTYVRLLEQYARLIWKFVEENRDAPWQVLQGRLRQPLQATRFWATYQRIANDYLASVATDFVVKEIPQATLGEFNLGENWPIREDEFRLNTYSGYSNGNGMAGVQWSRPRWIDEKRLIESVGVQVQGDSYRCYLSWDFILKRQSGKGTKEVLRRLEEEDVRGNHKEDDRVRERARHLIPETCHDAPWSARNYDHRWRGWARKVPEGSTLNDLATTISNDIVEQYEKLVRG